MFILYITYNIIYIILLFAYFYHNIYNFYYYLEKFRTCSIVLLKFFPSSPTHMLSSFFKEICTAKKMLRMKSLKFKKLNCL